MSKSPTAENQLDKNALEQKLIEFKRKINSTLIYQKYFFFNLLLHRFSWKIDFECPGDSFGYIRFRNIDINEIENGTIYIAGWFLNQKDIQPENFLFFLIHELLHIVFMHGPRRKDRDPYTWNLAGDQVINLMIRNLFTNKTHVYPYKGYGVDGGCICYDEFDGINLNNQSLTTEEVYDIFDKRIQQFQINISSDGSSFEITDTNTGKTFRVSLNKTNGKKDNELSPEEKAAIQRFGRLSRELYKNTRDRGLIPKEIVEYFDRFFNTELPWNKILENIIRKSFNPKPNGRGWQTINKLFLPHGYTLPGVIYEDERNVGHCIVSIDTSGSIKKNDLEIFANTLIESLNYFEKITMITHDASIHQIEEFTKMKKDELLLFVKKVGFMGRGGTSHAEVFDKIQELQKKDFNGIDLYLSLTDGYSDIDEVWSKNNWSYKKEIPTCFILTDQSSIPKICQNTTKIKYVKIKNNPH